MPPKKYANLSGRLKSHGDDATVKDLANALKSAASLNDLPLWAGTLPVISYPNIKTNRRPTTACKNALAKHSDLMNAIQLLCKKWGKTLKLERTTIRDALLEAFVTTETTKPTVKHEAKASTIAMRMYLMITHQRRINKCPKTSAEEEHEGAEDDAQDSGEQDDQEGELGTEEEHDDAPPAPIREVAVLIRLC